METVRTVACKLAPIPTQRPTLDAAIVPGRVFVGHADNELLDLLRLKGSMAWFDPMYLQPEENQRGYRQPSFSTVRHSLHLTPDAHAVLQDFEAWLEPQLAPFGTLGQMTDWAGKLVGTVARLCGILHMASYGDAAAAWTLLISKEHVEHAICLGHYLIPHAQSAYDEMEADPITADATYLLAWIRRASPQQFTKREAFEGTKGRFKRVAAMEPALQLLIEHDFIRPSLPQERSGPGRKPSPIYLVNPLGASQNAQNAQNAVPSPYSANSANSATGKSHIETRVPP